MIIQYICEFCLKDFTSKEECEAHENEHDIELLISKNPDTIKCPECDGMGWVDGTVGFDMLKCPICNGGRIVKKRIVPKRIVYDAIK